MQLYQQKHLTLLLLVCLSSVMNVMPQEKKREMRGVWIATVANIDWPSKQGLSSDEQRNEMRLLLNELQKNKINCIVLQVRPTADAIYPSSLEPWSSWLSGAQGQRPNPYYDPLQFVIEEAHKRCMEVHVWLNPYRVTTNSNRTNNLHEEHLFYKNKDLFVKYGNAYYFNPGLDETRNFLNVIVKDLVERYDVDAIHFDDYFYPYPIPNTEFPDELTFRNNPRGFSEHQKDDWRRNNVDLIISELQQTIKSIKPWVQFGISPFGVWRNNDVDPRGSVTRAGIQNYDNLYADILKWLREGTIDYVAPQLYWEIGRKDVDYPVLLHWWSQNSYGKNLYIGQFASGLENGKTQAWKTPNEIIRQINLNREVSNVDGSLFFSAKPFLKNIQGLNDSLQNTYYKHPAIQPVNRNIPGEPSGHPENLRILKDGKDLHLVWDPVEGDAGFQNAYYAIYAFKGKRVGNMNDPTNLVALTTETSFNLLTVDREFQGTYTFVVSSVNRYKQESKATYAVSRRL